VLGKYSYGIYVIHFPVVQLLVWHTDIGPEAASWAGFQLAGMIAVAFVASAITLVLTLLSWKLLETPFLSLKSRFRTGHVRMSWSN
jgi:peptidoglycan/LPS O-acetylase OafA/YrhL